MLVIKREMKANVHCRASNIVASAWRAEGHVSRRALAGLMALAVFAVAAFLFTRPIP